LSEEQLRSVAFSRGFLAALDQSGGSTAKALASYGATESTYSTEEEMFDLIHEFRRRIITQHSHRACAIALPINVSRWVAPSHGRRRLTRSRFPGW
jgi:fructose-bisphosphate aldolase class 1